VIAWAISISGRTPSVRLTTQTLDDAWLLKRPVEWMIRVQRRPAHRLCLPVARRGCGMRVI